MCMKDIDWRTIIFFCCLFALVQAVNKTGILQSLSQNLYAWFGTNLVVIALVLVAGVGVASSLLANIPIVAAMLLMLKGYFVTAELVPDLALAADLYGLARAGHPCICGHDVRGNARRQCNPDRRLGQCGRRRRLRSPWQAGFIYDIPALRRALYPVPAGRGSTVCAGSVLLHGPIEK